MRLIASGAFFVLLSFIMMPTNSAAPTDGDGGRGCCSHHHGVCGCTGGRTMCCDGTQSPTCGCAVPESER